MGKRHRPAARGLTAQRCQQLDALYAELPTIECRGSCWDSCGPIQMTGLEHRRTEAAGVAIPDGHIRDGLAVCPALTMLHQCAVYEVRPLICRLWGLLETMPCTFGCRPADGRLLTDEQAHEFMARVHDIAGEHAEAELIRRPWRQDPERARRIMADLSRQRLDAEFEDEVRRRSAVASGAPALYVRGRGHVSSTPPASGANANPTQRG